MNRRKLLIASGLAATSVALRATGTAAPARKLRIVVTGGHPGDPEYACGGTIARLAALGHDLTLLYLNNGAWETAAEIRMAEASKACRILNAHPAYAGQANGHSIVDDSRYAAFRKLLEDASPDAVFTHWPIDNHPDHRAVFNLTFEAWKQLHRSFALYYFEVSDGEDTLQFGPPTHYVDIASVAETKRAACFAHASQSPDRFYDLQDSVARQRGIECGLGRAEAFTRQIGNPCDAFALAGLPTL